RRSPPPSDSYGHTGPNGSFSDHLPQAPFSGAVAAGVIGGVGAKGDEAGKPSAFGLTRRALVGAGAACLTCLAFEGLRPSKVNAEQKPAPLTDTTVRRRHIQPDAVFRVPTNKPIVALSFDDGPDPRYTPQVLDI